MIDIQNERVITLKEAAARLASSLGAEPHLSSVFRWTRHGVQGPGGERVRLESVKIGGKRCTSEEAIARFVARANGSVPKVDAKPRSRRTELLR